MILYKMLLLFMWSVLKNSKRLCDKWNCLTESTPWKLTRNWFFLKLNWKLLKATVTFRLSDKQFKGSKIKNYLLSWGVNPPSLIYLEKLYYYFSFLLRIMFEKCLSFFIWLRNFWQAWVFCRLSCVTVLSIIFISLPLFGDVSGGPESKGSPLLGASTLHLEEKDKIDLKSPRQQLLFQLFLAEKAKVPITIQDFPFEYYPSAGELLALPKGTKIAGSVLDDQFNWLLGFQQKYLRETLEDSNLYRAAYYRKLDRDYIKQYKNLRNISKIPNSSVKKPSLFYYIFDHMNFQGGMDTILKQYISNALINKAIRAKASVVEDSRACYTSLPVKKVPPKFINPVFSTFASDFPMLNSDFYRNPGRIHKSSASGFSATNIWTPFNIYPRADFTHAGFAGRYAFMYPYWPMTSKYDLPKWPFTHEESWLRHSVNQRLLFDEPDAYRAWGEQYVCDQANLWGQKELKEERLFYAFYSRRKPLPKPYFNPLQQIRSVVQKGDNFSGNAGRFSPASNLSDEIFQAWKQKYSGFSLSKPSPESRVEEQWYQAKLFAFDKKYKMAQNLRNFQDSLFSFNNIRLFLNREQMLYLRNHLEFMPQRLQVAPLPVMDAVRFSDLSRKQSRNRWDLVRNWQAYLENELPANRKDSQANLNFNFQSIIDRYKQPFLYVFDLYKSSEERNRWKNMFEFHLRYHLLKQDKVVPTIKYVATSCWSLRPYFNLLTWNGFRYGTSFLNWFESVIGPKTWGIDEAAIIFFGLLLFLVLNFCATNFFDA